MLKTLMMSAAVSTLMVSGALAQANPPMAPPATPAAKTDAAPVDGAKFIQSQGTDQWVFSKFKGTDVIGPDNAQVGDVNDVLFDKSGKVVAYVVGVGGFLGIGSKDVALTPSSFQVQAATDREHMKLRLAMTKDELKAAAEFKPYKEPTATTGMAPRDRAPVTPPPARQ